MKTLDQLFDGLVSTAASDVAATMAKYNMPKEYAAALIEIWQMGASAGIDAIKKEMNNE